jgi:small subunit ribosomal protein S20
MPIKHAAMKQMRKDKKRQQRNAATRSGLRTLSKQLLALIQEKKLDEASTFLRRVAKAYDRAASHKIIHRNTAARYKSRISKKLRKSTTR